MIIPRLYLQRTLSAGCNPVNPNLHNSREKIEKLICQKMNDTISKYASQGESYASDKIEFIVRYRNEKLEVLSNIGILIKQKIQRKAKLKRKAEMMLQRLGVFD